MHYYLAPMEGLTGFVYRGIHHRFFSGTDKYFMPFLSANQNLSFTNREKREIDPGHNRGYRAVPQILTKDAGQLVWAAGYLAELGYDEVNLNLGCPSATVTAKGKGAGMLRDPDALMSFFDAVFSKLSGIPIRMSVKTRLGWMDPEESARLMEVFNSFPFSEIIIHARVKTQLYEGEADRDYFGRAYLSGKNPVVYNGDLLTKEDIEEAGLEYPDMNAVMAGRGIMINPALFREASGGSGASKQEYHDFMKELYYAYLSEYGSARNVLYKMQDLWKYASQAFGNNDRALRRILKSKTGEEYLDAVEEFFDAAVL